MVQVVTNGGPPKRLAQVTKGPIKKPLRVVVYGADGVGKSTFAARAPRPIFVGAEDGTASLDVSRLSAESWRDIVAIVAELEADPHEYETLVLDTADWAEPMCWDVICKSAGAKSIAAIDYGKGYDAAEVEWRSLLGALDRLRDRRGMNAIVLAHSQIKTFKNPAGGDFDRYELKLHKAVAARLREWSDAVLFAHHETFTVAGPQKGKHKGVSSGARVVATTRTAAWDAKNRHDLPEILPLDWTSFVEAVAAHRPADPAKLRDSIADMIAKVADESLVARVRAATDKAGDDAVALARIENHLRATITIKENA